MTQSNQALGLSRRRFVQGATALTFAIATGGISAIRSASAEAAPLDVNHWLTIRTDGTISIVFPSTEMGPEQLFDLATDPRRGIGRQLG